MFKYVEETENKKLDNLKKELKIQKEEKSIYKQRFDYIDAYDKIIADIKDLKTEVICYSGFLALSIIAYFLTPVALVVSFISIMAGVIQTRKLISKRQEIKRDYSDICTLTKEQIECEKQLLYKILGDYSASEERIESDINNASLKLSKVESAKKVMNNPYYQADTEEEYYYLKQKQEEQLEVLNDFLDEKVDYSNVHFDNNIGENIEYTENSKQLMKKI